MGRVRRFSRVSTLETHITLEIRMFLLFQLYGSYCERLTLVTTAPAVFFDERYSGNVMRCSVVRYVEL
jgi:hypothetical protein